MEQVIYTRKGEVETFQIGLPGLEAIVADHSGVPPEERNGLAKRLLASAVLSCYGAMLAAVLDARQVHYTGLTGRAIVELGPNSKGQGRVRHIHIAFSVALPRGERELFERSARVMQNGCLVTGSLHEGIAMSYELNAIHSD